MLPQTSDKVHVRRIVPVLLQPESAVLSSTKVAAIPVLQLSDSSVTSPVLTTETSTVQFTSKLKVTSAGSVNVGAIKSSTVIVCVWLLVLPHSSVNVQVLKIVPVPLQPVSPVLSSE